MGWIDCSYNQLTSLPKLPAAGVHYIDCYDNQLTGLPIQLNKRYRSVHCNGGQRGMDHLIKNEAVKMIISFYRRRRSVNNVVKQSRLYHDELYLRGIAKNCLVL